MWVVSGLVWNMLLIEPFLNQWPALRVPTAQLRHGVPEVWPLGVTHY
jgi:hypothetical protein